MVNFYVDETDDFTRDIRGFKPFQYVDHLIFIFSLCPYHLIPFIVTCIIIFLWFPKIQNISLILPLNKWLVNYFLSATFFHMYQDNPLQMLELLYNCTCINLLRVTCSCDFWFREDRVLTWFTSIIRGDHEKKSATWTPYLMKMMCHVRDVDFWRP